MPVVPCTNPIRDQTGNVIWDSTPLTSCLGKTDYRKLVHTNDCGVWSPTSVSTVHWMGCCFQNIYNKRELQFNSNLNDKKIIAHLTKHGSPLFCLVLVLSKVCALLHSLSCFWIRTAKTVIKPSISFVHFGLGKQQGTRYHARSSHHNLQCVFRFSHCLKPSVQAG